MPDYLELHDEFRKGKATRRGRPLPPGESPPTEPVVTLVHPASVDAFIGARSYGERLAHLRRLRDEGILIHNRGRLTQVVRGQGVRCAYVFRRRAAEVPKVEPAAPTAPTRRRGGRGRVGVLTA